MKDLSQKVVDEVGSKFQLQVKFFIFWWKDLFISTSQIREAFNSDIFSKSGEKMKKEFDKESSKEDQSIKDLNLKEDVEMKVMKWWSFKR